MTSEIKNFSQVLENPNHTRSEYLLPQERAYYKSWLNNIEHYMIVECSADDNKTTIARTLANNILDIPYLPGVHIVDMDHVVHVRDLERGESFVFNVRDTITDPIKMLQVIHR